MNRVIQEQPGAADCKSQKAPILGHRSSAGNLEPVARAVRKQYPNAQITIAADNDQWTPKNTGKRAGQRAALAIRAALILPDFTGLDTSGRPTDFNDLIALGGAI